MSLAWRATTGLPSPQPLAALAKVLDKCAMRTSCHSRHLGASQSLAQSDPRKKPCLPPAECEARQVHGTWS